MTTPSTATSDDAEKKANLFFQTGDKAVSRGDFDYAVECFNNCCRLVPGKLLYRQALRGAQRKLHNNNGKGVAMAGFRMKPAQGKMMMARRSSNWKAFIEAAEECLALNPWDTSTLFEEGVALAELEQWDAAIWVLETAQDKKTPDIYRKLAEVYEGVEQFEKAIRSWEMVSKLDPGDENALSKMRQLAASATIQKGKFDQEKDPDNADGTSKTAAPETYEARLSREIEEMVHKLEEAPGSVQMFRDIGENYRRLGNLEKAAEFYRRGVEASQNTDIDLLIRLKEVEVEPYRRKLADAEQKKTQVDPRKDPETAKKISNYAKACNAEICKREAEIYRLKVQNNPDDFVSHYELGLRNLKLGELDESIKSLQKGRNDTQHRWQAMLYLGVAFWRKKNFTLAEKNLADALEAVGPVNEEGRKDIIYYSGRVAQDAGDKDRALANFNEIAAIDYEYKDVAKRIDEINSQG